MTVIVDYGIGNRQSVLNMLNRLGIPAMVSGDPDDISRANDLILPGVGNFDSCMLAFNESKGADAVRHMVEEKKVKILGICAGAQMMTQRSEEGAVAGLGWIDGETIRFRIESGSPYKVPNMGWEEIAVNRKTSVFSNVAEDARFYFTHSYHFNLNNKADELATCFHGYSFPCAFQSHNIFGVQFHPEKSHRFGMQLLKDFISC